MEIRFLQGNLFQRIGSEAFRTMRRFSLMLCAFLAWGMSLPAHAASVTETRSGTILVPTYGTPSVARLSYTEADHRNGETGYVFALTVKSFPGQLARFSLAPLGGTTGLESFDLNFYSSMEQLNLNDPTSTGWVLGHPVGDIFCGGSSPTCTGTVPVGANYAIVTLSVGWSGSFRYTASRP
ncbi:MAG: hypothetical protein NVSMB57_04030 [Actinomycetota bacterium]